MLIAKIRLVEEGAAGRYAVPQRVGKWIFFRAALKISNGISPKVGNPIL